MAMRITHECVCDCCGKTVDAVRNHDPDENREWFTSPDGWEQMLFDYKKGGDYSLFCPRCHTEITSAIATAIDRVRATIPSTE